jgi:hypothetical protein
MKASEVDNSVSEFTSCVTRVTLSVTCGLRPFLAFVSGIPARSLILILFSAYNEHFILGYIVKVNPTTLATYYQNGYWECALFVGGEAQPSILRIVFVVP